MKNLKFINDPQFFPRGFQIKPLTFILYKIRQITTTSRWNFLYVSHFKWDWVKQAFSDFLSIKYPFPVIGNISNPKFIRYALVWPKYLIIDAHYLVNVKVNFKYFYCKLVLSQINYLLLQ